MKKMICLPAFLLVLAAFWASCERNSESENFTQQELLMGNWANPVWLDSVTVYQRVEKLSDGGYGFSINSDHTFLERKNSGWCGTPPVTYADYTDSWDTHDSLINISVGYWGGIQNYRWKIVSVDTKFLKVIMLPANK